MNAFRRQLQLSDFKESVTIFRDLIIFFAIISYFMGWVYLNEYLSHFGLYLANLDIPFHYYFIFSYPPMLEAISEPTWSDGIYALVIIVMISLTVAAYKVRVMAGYFMVAACFLCILLIAFELASGKSQGHARYVLDGGGKKIAFIFDSEIVDVYGSAMADSLQAANIENRLRLVWRTDRDVYVVDVEGQYDGKPTFRVPVSSFVFSRVIGNTWASE